MSTVIKVENISKQYRLGDVGTGALSHDLKRWWYKARGKEDPYLQIGETNDRSSKGNSEYVWALKDINFEVKAGEVLGIIGRNGAGKSTLLKILSKTTTPTTGNIKVRGRIASLLEVGTGFHPELSGRENIYLNGAILGMTKREIQKKFDEIVDFSGVERYIDTPVKRYSSGMYVRLAFAVAAHLEPEILIIDEVLAVGDAEFQKKCLGKMKDVSVNEGRTVLFVSHNLNAILNLCDKSLLMNNGQLVNFSDTSTIVNQYQSHAETITKIQSDNYKIFNIKISKSLISIGEPLEISFNYEKFKPEIVGYVVFNIMKNDSGITSANTMIDNCQLLSKSNGEIKLIFPKVNILVGRYSITIGIKDETGKVSLIPTTTIDDFEIIYDFENEGLSVPLDDINNQTSLFIRYSWSINGKPVENESLNKINKLFWEK